MKTVRLARLLLVASAIFLIASIIVTIVGYMVFLSQPLQGPFDGYRLREISIGLTPYLLLTGAFFCAWLARSRVLQLIFIILYGLLGLYVAAVGVVVWSHTGNILALIFFPAILLISLPSLIAIRQK